jgi:predicted CopG family antitoxin
MPYFKNDNCNILFIHIPKTGGTSLEKYFSKKYDIVLDTKSLYCTDMRKIDKNIKINSSLQHMTYNEIIERKEILNIDFNNIFILSIVRNPYKRIISDLFYFKLIKINSSKEEVYEVIQKYIISTKYDNHNLPQYIFVTDDNKEVIENIKILKTENLTNNMKEIGYEDFDRNDNKNPHEVEYLSYLNNESFEFINNFYDYDFELFNYDKIIEVQ